GTSTDVCLIRGGRVALAFEGQIAGLPNRAPQIELNTVGAGGGSIAWLDAGGFLNVGPRSAGAVPGPACYGRGGTEPTVTDANVVLGRFRPGTPLGGEIEIDSAAAERAVAALAERLGLSTQATAEGIVRIAVTRMTGAIKEISVMRGLDPRDFTLFAFGGAGPLHAALIAAELGMREVIVPPLCGAFSALGLLHADQRRDVSRTRLLPLHGERLETLRTILKPMREVAAAELELEGVDPQRIRFECSVDMRYVGQAFELNTPLDDGIEDIEQLIERFHDLYEQRYSHTDRGEVEAVAFRVSAYAQSESPRPAAPSVSDGGLDTALLGHREVRFEQGSESTPIYARERLPRGAHLTGPALIEEDGSVTLVPPAVELEWLEDGTLRLTLAPMQRTDAPQPGNSR
ncbi:MAG: hydantoinase/oxoprolinase family protein, partial [Gammaproteobacteria bacterium]|nr:hydantoinase/oxoprolinase family protein [Gammaproteobacteria bacterium]